MTTVLLAACAVLAALAVAGWSAAWWLAREAARRQSRDRWRRALSGYSGTKPAGEMRPPAPGHITAPAGTWWRYVDIDGRPKPKNPRPEATEAPGSAQQPPGGVSGSPDPAQGHTAAHGGYWDPRDLSRMSIEAHSACLDGCDGCDQPAPCLRCPLATNGTD